LYHNSEFKVWRWKPLLTLGEYKRRKTTRKRGEGEEGKEREEYRGRREEEEGDQGEESGRGIREREQGRGHNGEVEVKRAEMRGRAPGNTSDIRDGKKI
jgi:hypothetical protein